MFDDDEIETDDIPCPACGHHETRSHRCSECDDGYTDAYDEDPINEDPGTLIICGECSGSSIVRWCPKCNADYWRAKKRGDIAGKDAK